MFDYIGDNIGLLLVLLVVLWAAQFGMAYIQMRRFYGRLRVLRKDGLTAVGLAGTRYRGRNYAVLVIDDDDHVVHAEKFTGWTVFAGLKPVPALIGMPLSEVLDESVTLPLTKKLREAFRNAALDLHEGREAQLVAPEPEPG